jgi:hypothetical protein
MDVNATVKNGPETLPVTVTINNQPYAFAASVLYSAHREHGTFKTQ